MISRTHCGTFLSSLVILAASIFRYRAEKQTDTQTNGGKSRTPATADGVGKKMCISNQLVSARNLVRHKRHADKTDGVKCMGSVPCRQCGWSIDGALW